MTRSTQTAEIPLRSPANEARPVHCSFCLKPQSELKALIAGPGLVFNLRRMRRPVYRDPVRTHARHVAIWFSGQSTYGQVARHARPHG
ncbi:MAG: hypothetical protein J0I79_12495 [Mesorhizobium sp.]|nr:hypothetical protein [Mesorhizobium sp.]